MDSFDDPFADSNDVFDDDDPFSYSKSKAQEKSSFMSYTKDGSSAAGGADMSGMSLKERAKMMLSASRNSSKSKQSSKSAKKKNRRKSSSYVKGGGSTSGHNSTMQSAKSVGSPNKSDAGSILSKTTVDDKWTSRLDALDDDLEIDAKDWETPQERAEREAREAKEAAELAAAAEASSIANGSDDSIHRISRTGALKLTTS